MISASKQDDLLVLTLDRPAQRNAMSAALVDALIEAVDSAGRDDAVGAILLTGAGRGFCAGSDLAGLAAMNADEKAGFEAASGEVARMLGLCPKPAVAAAHGFAIGGGLTLATSCDIVVTEPDARWSLPEVPIGLFPAWGLGSVIARVGAPTARRLSWGIDTLDGREAVRIGLADILVEGDVGAKALEVAKQLAALPRRQSVAVKRYFADHVPDAASDERANRLFMDATRTPEAIESFEKFAKRG